MTSAFLSVPSDMSQFSAASFLAGIIAGVLDSAHFVRNSHLEGVLCLLVLMPMIL
jgi:hypothetical protein